MCTDIGLSIDVCINTGGKTENKMLLQKCDLIPLRSLFKKFRRPRGVDPELWLLYSPKTGSVYFLQGTFAVEEDNRRERARTKVLQRKHKNITIDICLYSAGFPLPVEAWD